VFKVGYCSTNAEVLWRASLVSFPFFRFHSHGDDIDETETNPYNYYTFYDKFEFFFTFVPKQWVLKTNSFFHAIIDTFETKQDKNCISTNKPEHPT
jgi:hypothetical protein